MVPNVMQSMEKPTKRCTLLKPFCAPRELNSPVPVPVKASRPLTQVPRPFMHVIMRSSFCDVMLASVMFFSASRRHLCTSFSSCARASSWSLRTSSRRELRLRRFSSRVSPGVPSSSCRISRSRRRRSEPRDARFCSSRSHFACMRRYCIALWKEVAAHLFSTESECITRYVRPAPEIRTMRASRRTDLFPEICWRRSEAAGRSDTIRMICESSPESKPLPSSSTFPKKVCTCSVLMSTPCAFRSFPSSVGVRSWSRPMSKVARSSLVRRISCRWL
mmetsp:Transcript_82238/g.255373  ORF Transcript_82238/g.255373 Transcript_82238/m.255373 type:complete len:276 (-) Transcript_82238:252-1079(-)